MSSAVLIYVCVFVWKYFSSSISSSILFTFLKIEFYVKIEFSAFSLFSMISIFYGMMFDFSFDVIVLSGLTFMVFGFSTFFIFGDFDLFGDLLFDTDIFGLFFLVGFFDKSNLVSFICILWIRLNLLCLQSFKSLFYFIFRCTLSNLCFSTSFFGGQGK